MLSCGYSFYNFDLYSTFGSYHKKYTMSTDVIKVLLVDDEPDILEIVGYNLSAGGYQVFYSN